MEIIVDLPRIRDLRERAEERLNERVLKFTKKLDDLQKDVDVFRRKDVRVLWLKLYFLLFFYDVIECRY